NRRLHEEDAGRGPEPVRRDSVTKRRGHGDRPAGNDRLAQVAALSQRSAGEHHQGRYHHTDRGQEADFEGARAQLMLVDRAEGDEWTGPESRETMCREQQPATPIDPHPGLRAVPRGWSRTSLMGAAWRSEERRVGKECRGGRGAWDG